MQTASLQQDAGKTEVTITARAQREEKRTYRFEEKWEEKHLH